MAQPPYPGARAGCIRTPSPPSSGRPLQLHRNSGAAKHILPPLGKGDGAECDKILFHMATPPGLTYARGRQRVPGWEKHNAAASTPKAPRIIPLTKRKQLFHFITILRPLTADEFGAGSGTQDGSLTNLGDGQPYRYRHLPRCIPMRVPPMSIPALARICSTATGWANRSQAVVAKEPPALG